MRGNANAEGVHLLGAVDALNTRRHDASLRDGKSRNDKDCDKGLVHDETSHVLFITRQLYFSSGDKATAGRRCSRGFAALLGCGGITCCARESTPRERQLPG